MKRTVQMAKAGTPRAMSSKKKVDTRVGKPKREWRPGLPHQMHPVRTQRMRLREWLKQKVIELNAHLMTVDVGEFITGEKHADQ